MDYNISPILHPKKHGFKFNQSLLHTMAKREWKTISSSTAYEDSFMRIRKDEVINPGGNRQHYAFVENRDAVGIIAQDGDGGIYLLQEYRYPIKQTVWQLSAGHIEQGLSILENAKKELKEETGITAQKWKELGSFYMHGSLETMQGHIFLAQELNKTRMGHRGQDDNEMILEVEKIPLNKVKEMIRKNEIQCGWTLAALNLFFMHEEKN